MRQKYYWDPKAKCPSAHHAQIMKNLEPWSGFSISTRSDSHSQCPSRVSRCPQRSSSARGWPWLGGCRSAGWRPGRHETLQWNRDHVRTDVTQQGRLLYEVKVCDFTALFSASQLLCFSYLSINDWIWSLLFLGSSRRRFGRGRPSWWSWSGGWCLGVWPPRQSTPASVAVLFLRRTTETTESEKTWM